MAKWIQTDLYVVCHPQRASTGFFRTKSPRKFINDFYFMSHDTEAEGGGKTFSPSHESSAKPERGVRGRNIDTALLSRVTSIQCPITDNEALFCLYFSYSRLGKLYKPENISGRKNLISEQLVLLSTIGSLKDKHEALTATLGKLFHY